jgi:flagellar FliL protein
MSEADKTTTEKPAGKSVVIPILLGFNSLLMAAVLGVVLLRPGASGHAKEAKEKDAAGEHGEAGHGGPPPPAIGPMVRMGDFVVHLRNPEADRYARMSFEIEVNTEEEKNAITPLLPRIRDVFISYLSDRTLEELQGSEGLEKVKHALIAKMGDLGPASKKPRAIYITDFIVQ